MNITPVTFQPSFSDQSQPAPTPTSTPAPAALKVTPVGTQPNFNVGFAPKGKPSIGKQIFKFGSNVASDARDLGDMLLGTPALMAKTAVEDVVTAYKNDPKAGYKAGEDFANNPIVKPWFTPLKSAQQAFHKGKVSDSQVATITSSLLGQATQYLQAKGKEVGMAPETVSMLIDDFMSGAGLKGLHEVAKGVGAAAAKAGEGKPKAEAAPEDFLQKPVPQLPAPEPKPIVNKRAMLGYTPPDVTEGRTSVPPSLRLPEPKPETAPIEAGTKREVPADMVTRTPSSEPVQLKTEGITPPAQQLRSESGLVLPDRTSLDAGLQKIREGRAFDMTAEERLAVSRSLPTGRMQAVPRGQAGEIDPELLKYLGYGAAGAGLAYLTDSKDKWMQAGAAVAGAVFGPKLVDAAKARGAFSADTRMRITDEANKFDYEVNKAELTGQAFSDSIRRAVPDPARRSAISHALEGAPVPLSQSEQKIVGAIRQYYSTMLEKAQAAGVVGEGRNNYVTHVWDFGTNRSGYRAASMRTTSPFGKERTIPTLAQGKELGLTPLTEDAADLVEIYNRSMTKAIAGRDMVNALKGRKAPDGSSLIQPAATAPKNYEPVNIPGLRGMLVHPDIAPALRWFEAANPGPVSKALSEFTQAVKRMNISFSLFHAKALTDAALTSSNKFWKLPGKVARLAANTDEMLKQLSRGEVAPDVDAALRHGVIFRIGRASPAVEDVGGSFYTGMQEVQSMLDNVSPVLGKPVRAFADLNHKIDEITFSRLQTGLKLQLFSEKYHQLMDNGVAEKQAGEIAASYANDTFGGLNWRRIAEGARTRLGRDISLSLLRPASRSMAQILMFAPDWTLSTVRNVTKAFKFEGHPIKGLLNPTTVADLHRQTLLRSAVYYLTVGDAINYALSGHHIWENKKDKLSIDLGDGRRIDFARHMTEPLRWVEDPVKTAAGKLAFIPSQIGSVMAGKEWLGPNAPKMQESVPAHLLKGVLPFGASAESPTSALAGLAGIPIHGYTAKEKAEMRRKAAMKNMTPEAPRERIKKLQQRD